MTLSCSQLLAFQVPVAQQVLTPQDAAFYALSVGFGQDPMDQRELAFVDPTPSLRAVPSMALVLAYPGFWLGSPEVGLDAAKIAHVEQAVLLHKPLPTAGRILGHTQVTGVFDRGGAKGLVIESERRLLDAADNSAIATLRQTHFLRGDHCADAPPYVPAAREEAPRGNPCAQIDMATRPEQALYYRLNGDRNPLHIDPAVAAKAGFARPILHGMCTFGVVTRAVLAARCEYQPQRIGAISMRFRAPVFPGDTLRVSIWPCGALQVRAVERDTLVIDAGRVSLAQDETPAVKSRATPLAEPQPL